MSLSRDQSAIHPLVDTQLIISIALQAIRSARAYLTQTLKLSASSAIGTGAHGPLLHMAPFHANRMMRKTGRQHSYAMQCNTLQSHVWLTSLLSFILPKPHHGPSTTTSTTAPLLHLSTSTSTSTSTSFIHLRLLLLHFFFSHTTPTSTSSYRLRIFRRQSTKKTESRGPLALRSNRLIFEWEVRTHNGICKRILLVMTSW